VTELDRTGRLLRIWRVIAVVAVVLLVVTSLTDFPPRFTPREPDPTFDPFSGPLVGPQLAGPVDLAGARVALDQVSIPALSAFGQIELRGQSVELGMKRVDYRVDGLARSAWASVETRGSDCAVLLIPGTGWNMGTEIMARTGIHGSIVDTLTPCDVAVLVKPNEDARAIHDGRFKLNDRFIYPHMLQAGGSYAATYLAEARAVLLSLKHEYELVGVGGLSQGGWATMYVVLQEAADFAIVSSGFVVGFNGPVHGPSSMSQIIIPGLLPDWSLEGIASRLSTSSTEWLFTFGRGESGPVGEDARSGTTCAWLASTGARVNCVVHDGGHEFPTSPIADFLGRQLAARRRPRVRLASRKLLARHTAQRRCGMDANYDRLPGSEARCCEVADANGRVS
jgi:hypothetical protein